MYGYDIVYIWKGERNMKMRIKQGTTYFHFKSYNEFLANTMFLIGYSKKNVVEISLDLQDFLYLEEVGHISNIAYFCKEHNIGLNLIQERCYI